MASSGELFDTVKAEKADAIRRYKRQRIFTLCLHSAVTLALVFCFFFTLINPVFPGMSSSLSFSSVLNRQFFIFGLINTLVIFIYNFSSGANKNDAVSINHDLYDQYVSFSSASSSRREILSYEVKDKQPDDVSPELEILVSDKQIVYCENAPAANANVPAVENLVRDVSIVKDDNQRFKRTRSEKYLVQEEKKRSQRRVLQRSETEINGREVVVIDCGGGDRRQRKSIVDMNNDEFRHEIESFIASKKKTLRDENFAVLMEEEEKERSVFTAITYM